MKIVKIEKVGKLPVYDISVKDAEHYILENGVVTHNSGLIYSANQAFIIGKSQEKDGTELSGWNFTLNAEKSRFVREKSKLPLQVLYDGGIQKYSGILDLALESGDVVKPSNGWFSLVDPDTGEMSDKKVRSKDTQTDEFLGVVIARASFKSFIRKKYKVSQMSEAITVDALDDVD
jgi:hypothetical protein